MTINDIQSFIGDTLKLIDEKVIIDNGNLSVILKNINSMLDEVSKLPAS